MGVTLLEYGWLGDRKHISRCVVCWIVVSVTEKTKSGSSKGEISFIWSDQGRPLFRKGGSEMSKPRGCVMEERSSPRVSSRRVMGGEVRQTMEVWWGTDSLQPYGLLEVL